MSLQAALSIASTHHKGHFIYHSHRQCLDVLEAIEAAKPSWYTEACAAFVQSVRDVPLYRGGGGHDNGQARSEEEAPSCEGKGGVNGRHATQHPVIVLEGMDGSGKSTVSSELVRRLSAALVHTPNPRFEDNVRECFRVLPEPLSRAFYCAANYLAADEVHQLRRERIVLLDRWWGSTCSMALATHAAHSSPSSPPDQVANETSSTSFNLPPVGSAVYQWPIDLLQPSKGFVLDVDETIRRKRAELRGGMRPEEHALAAKEDMRSAVKQSYRNMTDIGYVFIQEPTWPLAVNAIIDVLERDGIVSVGAAKRCTAEEIAAVSPY